MIKKSTTVLKQSHLHRVAVECPVTMIKKLATMLKGEKVR